ncbi:MAG: MBL fold metallo-hydrolase [Desulfosarcina sp.]
MPNRTKSLFASIVISLALLLCPPALLAEITITAIDVGQGDAVLVQHQSYRVLIDGGGQPNTVADHLSDRGISHLNLVVATHGHADHVRGLVDVLNRQSVDTVLYNGQTHTTLTFENFIDAIADSGADYQEPGRGDSLFYGDMQIQILHPEGSAKDYEGPLHDKNIVLKIVYGDFAAIISGDIEQEGELEILDSGLDVSAQVLEVGYHGSRTSSHPDWVKAVNPEFAFWQAGEDNSYGYPHQETLGTLESLGIDVIGTSTHGTITITASRNGAFSVVTSEPEEEPDSNTTATATITCFITACKIRSFR